jgi:ubiquinone/menaquinone biosynthesis C-methylase UbiE
VDGRLQRRVQRYGWDKAAAFYDQYWARQLEPAQSRMLVWADLQVGEHVLDVACGTGLVTFRAAESVGPQGYVFATDISEAMIERLNGTIARRGLTHAVGARRDAEDLELGEVSFDAALCGLGLMYVVDPVRALHQMHQALRPNGRVVTAVWGARGRCGWADIFPIVERRVASEVCPLFFQLGTGDSMCRALRAAGFIDIEIERITTTLRYDSGESACGAAFAGGPVALAYSRFDEPTRAEVHEEYLASIAAYRDGAGYGVPGEFVIARARPVTAA